MADVIENTQEAGRRILGLLGEGSDEMNSTIAWCAGRIAEAADEIARLRAIVEAEEDGLTVAYFAGYHDAKKEARIEREHRTYQILTDEQCRKLMAEAPERLAALGKRLMKDPETRRLLTELHPALSRDS